MGEMNRLGGGYGSVHSLARRLLDRMPWCERWCFVHSRPEAMDEPQESGAPPVARGGLKDEGEPVANERESRRCGPESTAWFIEEARQWRNFAWQVNRLAIAWGKAANAARPWYEAWVPERIDTKSYQYACLAILARQLTYAPTTTFASAGGHCPQNCANTLTVCGGCIDRSEVGNFIYGLIARMFQMTWLQTWGGGIAGNRGRRTNADAAAVELGWDLIDQGGLVANVCAFLAGRAVDWAKMQEDGHGCPPCVASVVPAANDHTTFPAVAGLAASAPITVTLPPTVTGQP